MTNPLSWSTTAASNVSVAGVSIAEGWAAASVNNAMRGMMADLAKLIKDQGGDLTTTGSANAYAVTTNMGVASYAKPLTIIAKANFTNTGAATLAVDGLGAKAIVRPYGTALQSGDIASGYPILVVYEPSTDVFVLMNPATSLFTSDPELAAIASLVSAANKLPYFTGSGTAALADFTAAGRALVDDADAAAQRTTLGLGTMAAQAASAVAITGGSITGITDLAVADGGTGASTAAAARTALGLVIGTDVQAFDSDLTTWAGKTAPSGVVVGTTDSQTLTNKTLTSPAITTPSGIVKGDVGLGNVDNTSDATKDAAVATLTNKTISGASNTISALALSMFSAGVIDTDVMLAANSDSRLATQKAAKAYADAIAAGGVTDPELLAIAGLTSAADRLPYFTGSGTASLATFTAAGRALVDDADAAAQRTTLGLAIGTNVQAFDATLTSLAALGTAADKLAYTTGVDTWAETAMTSFGRSLIDDADAATARTTLGMPGFNGVAPASIVDDAATSFTTPSATGILVVNGGPTGAGMAFYDTVSGIIISMVNSTPEVLAFTTGALTGTTGSDGNLTVSAHTDGKIYVENRLGATASVKLHLFDRGS